MEGADIDFGNLKDVRILKDLWEVYYHGIMDVVAKGKVDKDHPSPFPQPDEVLKAIENGSRIQWEITKSRDNNALVCNELLYNPDDSMCQRYTCSLNREGQRGPWLCVAHSWDSKKE